MNKFIHGNTYYSHAHPQEELERNFQKMLDLGLNAVRVAEIWPGWSVIEHDPGRYDYALLDDYVAKAVKNGLKVCMGVGINDTPFWLFTKYRDLRFVDYNLKRETRRVQAACIDHPEYRQHMQAFIEDITKHYNGVEGIFSWQLGNEIRYGAQYCDCPATRVRFREWLKELYQHDLEALNKEWGVYYHDWEEIYPYRSYEGPPTAGIAPHCLRTIQFQNWSLEELIRWGTGIMRRYTKLPIFHNNYGHSGGSGSHWRLTELCDITVIDIYAVTYDKPGFYNGFLLDTARSIASQQNKPLWIGETTAGQYGTFNRNYVDPRLIENCVIEQIGAGASGIFYFRHKAPVWEQPHKFTGSQTFLRIDESELEYARTPRNIAAFMERYEKRIISAKPVPAMVGIYYPEESIGLGKEAGYYKESLESAFGARAIWAGIQVPVEILNSEGICAMDLSRFKAIHIPVAYLLPSVVGAALKKYVQEGGTLICEGRPGYVNEFGLLYQAQPGAGLDEVCGAREDLFYNVESFKAIIKIDGLEETVSLPYFKQTYRLYGGQAFAVTTENEICGVKNNFSKGTTYLLGGAPSLHYRIGSGKYENGKSIHKEIGREERLIFSAIFRKLAQSCRALPPVKFSGGIPDLTMRYLLNDRELLVFCVNYSEVETAILEFDQHNYRELSDLTQNGEMILNDRKLIIPAMGWKVLAIK